MARLPAEFVRFLRDMEQDSMAAEQRRAEADPVKHKLSRVFPPGRPLNYRYYEGGTRRGRNVRFCWSTSRNVAGYFLAWREVSTKTETKRDQYIANRVKQRLIERCEARMKAHRNRKTKGTSK